MTHELYSPAVVALCHVVVPLGQNVSLYLPTSNVLLVLRALHFLHLFRYFDYFQWLYVIA